MIVTFGTLVAAWYLLSGGDSFEPGDVSVAVFAPPLSEAERAERQAAVEALVAPATLTVKEPDPPRASAEPQRAETPVVPTDVADGALRRVRGDRVFLHDGPDRSFGVLLELLEGEDVAILRTGAGGWVQVRALDGGAVGWVTASTLIQPQAQQEE